MKSSEKRSTVDTIESIKESFIGFEKDELADIIAYVLKVYVIDAGTSGCMFQGGEAIVSERTHDSFQKPGSFPELIDMLKEEYSFPELDLLSVEDERVYLRQGDKVPLLISVGKNRKQSVEAEVKKKEPVMEEVKSLNRFANLEIE